MASRLLVAKESFSHESNGYPETVSAGDVADPNATVVRRYPNAFKPLEVRFPAGDAPKPVVEQATAAPGEKRTTPAPTRRKKGDSGTKGA